MNVNSNVPPPPPLYLFDLNLVGKHFDNNNPGNISIGLLSTQNKIYILILYSVGIYESVCHDKYDTHIDNNS